MSPIDLTFPSARTGFVPSLYRCNNHPCAALRRTENGGASWLVTNVPRLVNTRLQLVTWKSLPLSDVTLNIHFADEMNGWMYGQVPVKGPYSPSDLTLQPDFWSTHDGGMNWTRIRLKSLRIRAGVIQMATQGAWTYLFGTSQYGGTLILGTRSTDNDWKVKSTNQLVGPAGGTALEGAFTFVGSNGWFIAGNDRGLDAIEHLTNDGTWRKWNTPTSSAFDGHFAPMVAVTHNIMLIETTTAGFAIPPASSVPPGWNNFAAWLFVSRDGGTSFHDLRRISSSSGVSYVDVPGLPATPVPGTILLARDTNAGEVLVRSTNWGQSWRIVLRHPIRQALFVNHATGYVISYQRANTDSDMNTSLLRSTDEGASWTVIHLAHQRRPFRSSDDLVRAQYGSCTRALSARGLSR